MSVLFSMFYFFSGNPIFINFINTVGLLEVSSTEKLVAVQTFGSERRAAAVSSLKFLVVHR